MKTDRRALALLAAAIVTASLVSCSSSEPEPVDADSLIGVWGSTEEGEAWIEFEEGGGVTGFDGCSDLDGNWSESESGSIITDNLATSTGECDADGVWLRETAYVSLDGGRLVVMDAGEEELGRLDRAE